MTHNQYTKALKIVARIERLTKQLEAIDIDLKNVRDFGPSTHFSLSRTSIDLYKEDVIIILSSRKAWLLSEIKFLEKQLALI